MKNSIPNIITSINLFCGCAAVTALFQGEGVWALYFIIAAALADYLDGLLARVLQAEQPLGKELDSLADIVSFGLVPGSIFYLLLTESWHSAGELNSGFLPAALPAYILTIFSALRLGRYNIDGGHHTYFRGLPTPACALFATGLLMIHLFDPLLLERLVVHPAVLYGMVLILSLLLVAPVRMFSLKFQSLGWRGNEIKYIYLVLCAVLIVLLKEAALASMVLMYIILSLITQKPYVGTERAKGTKGKS